MRPNAEQLAALWEYANRRHPSEWKDDLLDDWLNGKDATRPNGHLLRQVRNHYGPKWLASFHFTDGPWGQDYFEEAFQHYCVAALWSSNDESDESGGQPMDANYDIEDISIETTVTMRTMLEDFLRQAWPIRHPFWGAEQLGHDLWLTQNRHGVGFWDRFYGDEEGEAEGRRLTDIAHKVGEFDLYIGDDGEIYGA